MAARSERVISLAADFRYSSNIGAENKRRSHVILTSCSDADLGFLAPVLNVYVGMHVMITNNCDIARGIGNGTMGIVVGFVWNKEPVFEDNVLDTDDVQSPVTYVPQSVPKFILVKLTTSAALYARATVELTGLEQDIWPVKAITKNVSKCVNGFKANARMSQFPLLCADAMTFHKLQGCTIDSVLCIQSLKGVGLQAAYTALTRVRSLEQLYLMEPLSAAVAKNWRLSDGLRVENDRLQNHSARIIRLLHGLI